MATVRRVRLYPPHDPETATRVGIPRAGELYTADDARRLVGQGLASRSRANIAKPDPAKVRRSHPTTTREG